MGAQWAPVVTQAYFLINVHTKWLEEIAHHLSVNVKYIYTHTHITRISQHIYAQQIYIFDTGQGDQREDERIIIIPSSSGEA